jgi:rubrerythrin
MAGKTEIEMEFGIDLDSGDTDPGKGIEAGIRTEEKQSKFYSHMTEVLHNKELVHFFRFLSEEKNLQKEILEKTMRSLEGSGEWTRLEYDYSDLEEASRKAEELRGRLRMDAGDVDIIENAMGNEDKAVAFYEKFADVLRGDGNDFFRALAERGQRHRDLLGSLLDLVMQSGQVK